MKQKRLYLNLLIVMFISILVVPTSPLDSQISIYTSPTYRFELDELTNFTAVSRAPLSWEEDVDVDFNLTLEASGLNSSNYIFIDLIQFVYINSENVSEYGRDYNEDFLLNETHPIFSFNKTLDTPTDYNLFNISILIYTSRIIDPHEDNITIFTAYFPGSFPHIQVEREDVNPIIALPGFPDSLTFSRWIIIYVVILLVMITPALFVGIPKSIELSKSAYKKLKEYNTLEKREERRTKRLQKKLEKEEKKK